MIRTYRIGTHVFHATASYDEQAVAPAAENFPGWHATQVLLDEAPVIELAVPEGQSVALTDEEGQYAPAGQTEQ